MKIHEYQAKELLQQAGVNVPEYYIATSVEQIRAILKKTEWQSAVVKVQVHAGGRGKAGGVKVGQTPLEIESLAKELIGKKIINHQTGHCGMISHSILISPLVTINREYYLGLTISREKGEIVFIASPMGGIDIEDIARTHPDQILFLNIPPEGALRSYQLVRLSKFMKWEGEIAKQGHRIAKALTHIFTHYDASLVEINPLILTNENQLLALDAKIEIDANALYRQPVIKSFYDPSQIPLNEARAQEFDLSYIALDGTIGCMVNGAGLAMATMDIIHHYGGSPANFLDVGGSASKEKVAEGFKIILADPQVNAILVNIFGGIMNCETLAEGIIEAVQGLKIKVPLVVRMEGTHVKEGIKLLRDSSLPLVIASDLKEAAQKIVALSQQGAK